MELIDTHAHLEGIKDISAMVESAKANNIVAVIGVGADLETCETTFDISKEYPDYIYPALGIHPSLVEKDLTPAFIFIEKHLKECVAVGEVGLDYWSKIDRDLQRRVFTRLLDIASEADLPVSIHSRGAWEECYNTLKERGNTKAIFHWFSGPLETLRRVLDSGWLVSATPATEYSKAHRAAIRVTPLDSLVLETDSPVRYHGVESQPTDVAKTLRFVSELKGASENEVANKTTENARRILKLKL